MADCIILPFSAHYSAAVDCQKLVEFAFIETNIGLKAPVGALVVRNADDGNHRAASTFIVDGIATIIIPISPGSSSRIE